MTRMMADCRRWPSETNCSLVIIREGDEVVQAAAEHVALVHGHQNNEELRAHAGRFQSNHRVAAALGYEQKRELEFPLLVHAQFRWHPCQRATPSRRHAPSR